MACAAWDFNRVFTNANMTFQMPEDGDLLSPEEYMSLIKAMAWQVCPDVVNSMSNEQIISKITSVMETYDYGTEINSFYKACVDNICGCLNTTNDSTNTSSEKKTFTKDQIVNQTILDKKWYEKLPYQIGIGVGAVLLVGIIYKMKN